MVRTPSALALTILLSSTLALSACGSSSESDAADVAAQFHAALADRDGSAACALLSPSARSELKQSAGRPCPKAIVSERLPAPEGPTTVSVFDTAAEVRYSDETVFLARFDGGWKVMAAGCTPRPPHPHDCTISGG